jgi:hypothetical protein
MNQYQIRLAYLCTQIIRFNTNSCVYGVMLHYPSLLTILCSESSHPPHKAMRKLITYSVFGTPQFRTWYSSFTEMHWEGRCQFEGTELRKWRKDLYFWINYQPESTLYCLCSWISDFPISQRPGKQWVPVYRSSFSRQGYGLDEQARDFSLFQNV